MRRLFLLVASVILVDTMFYSAITPLLPQYADDLGLSKTAAGVLSASYAAGTLLAAVPSGFLAAKIGFRSTMLAGLALLGVSSVAFAFAEDVVVLDLARFAEGVGGACAWTGGLAWLLAAAPADRRGEVIGGALAAAIFGILLGPVIGSVATVTGPEVVFSSVAVIASGLAIWVWTTPGITPGGVPSVRRVAAAVATAPILFAFWLVVLPSVLSGLFDVLIPLRMDDLGASGIAVGAAFFVAAGIEAFTAPAIGRASDRRGRMIPIRAGLLASPIAALLLPLPESLVLLAVGLVIVVLAMSLIWTPAMALLSDNAEAAGLDLAFASALVSLAWAGGQVLGSSAFVGLADASTDAVAYALVAGLFVVTLAAVLARRRPALSAARVRVAADHGRARGRGR
ncbi:MAG TPA: MFS transporter [Solirubrobacterales bacterium]|nr:MFS transporter [Solirubrobacterales bacterium]